MTQQYVILVHGESCNYFIGNGGLLGVMSQMLARRFDNEEEARLVGQQLHREHKISRWEIKRAK